MKNRVLRYIACQKRIGNSYGTVLLFCGPPRVGKTSIAQSIAEAMHRPMVKISLAGVTEGAVLKGTSTIYSNSRPGRINDAIINSQSFAPLILLDRFDIIQLQGYTETEKFGIAKDYLLKNLYRYYSLSIDEISLSDEAILYLVREFSKESGVRKLNYTLRRIFEEAVYCKERGRNYKTSWNTEDVKLFFDAI